jgi:hypothetical protein
MRLAAMVVILGEMPEVKACKPRDKKPQREKPQTTDNPQPATRR